MKTLTSSFVRLLGLKSKSQNPFDILGLSRASKQAAVRPAFRKLAAKLHPDIAGTGDAAAFRQVLWAYRELSEADGWRRWRRSRGRFEKSMKFSNDFEELFEDAVDAGPDSLDEWEEVFRKRQAEKAAQVQKTQQQLVRRIIQGTYQEKGSNHGRPIFRKALETGESVAIYYWDEKDGADCDGWWIGAEVGGDMVFAFNVNQASMFPPFMGWRFPLRGPLDNSLRVQLGNNRSQAVAQRHEMAMVDDHAEADYAQAELLDACERGDLGLASLALQKGASPRKAGTHGRTPLHLAVWSSIADPPSSVKLSQLLIQSAADVNARDRDSNTPLHLCALSNEGIWPARLLLAYKADPILRNRQGLLPSDLIMCHQVPCVADGCEVDRQRSVAKEFFRCHERQRFREVIGHVKDGFVFLPFEVSDHAKLWSLH